MVFEHEFGKLVDNKDGHHGVVAICLLYFAALVFMEYYRGGEEDEEGEEEEEYPRRLIGCIKQESTDEEKGHEGEKNEFDYSNDEDVLLLFDSASNYSEDEPNTFRAGSASPPIEDVESISIQIDEEDDEDGDVLFDDENEWLLG